MSAGAGRTLRRPARREGGGRVRRPRGDLAEEHGSHLPGLLQLPYQPYEKLPDLLASADVLVAILERHAGVFSVPSKVLSYHCAGRPFLAALPADNLAARIITRERSGICVEPGANDDLIAAAERLEANPEMRTTMGADARDYAEQAFDIDRIGRSVLTIITDTAKRGRTARTGRRADQQVREPCGLAKSQHLVDAEETQVVVE